ncbi:hypothetical protein HN51_041439, partial [Arachis hypogaea]
MTSDLSKSTASLCLPTSKPQNYCRQTRPLLRVSAAPWLRQTASVGYVAVLLAPCHSAFLLLVTPPSPRLLVSPRFSRVAPSLLVSPCIAATPRLGVLTSQVLPSFMPLLMICDFVWICCCVPLLRSFLWHSAIRHLILRFCLLLQRTSIFSGLLEFWLTGSFLFYNPLLCCHWRHTATGCLGHPPE